MPEIKAGFAYTGDNPAQFATSLRGGGTVLPLLEAAADGIGTVNVSSDFSIGIVREAPLVWSAGDQIVPSLYGEALRVAQGAQTYVVHADGDGGIQSVRIGAFEVPTTPTGELYLHYTLTRPDRYVSAVDLFDKPETCKRVWSCLLSGAILDALEVEKNRRKANSADVERALAAFDDHSWEPSVTVGDGAEYRAKSPAGDHASALVFDGTVVHGSVVCAP